LIYDSPDAAGSSTARNFIGFFSRDCDGVLVPSPYHPLDGFSSALFDPIADL
jgi:hypothetical protein